MAHPVICPCPNCRGGAGWAWGAVIAVAAAIFAVAVFVAAHVVAILIGVAGVAAALIAYLVRVLYATGPLWRPAAPVQAPAGKAVEAATAPRAIEPRHVIPGVVLADEFSDVPARAVPGDPRTGHPGPGPRVRRERRRRI